MKYIPLIALLLSIAPSLMAEGNRMTGVRTAGPNNSIMVGNIGYNVGLHASLALPQIGDFLKGKGHNCFVMQGGTGSQSTVLADYTPAVLAAWVDFQQKTESKLVFVVNMNLLPAEVDEIYDLCTGAGLTFYAIRYGNEQYSPKFINSDLSSPAVTERTANMDAAKYLALFQEYNTYGLEAWIQLAPLKGIPSVDRRNTIWNDIIYANTLDNPDVHYTLHIYRADGFPMGQIPAIFDRIGDKSLNVTEWGLKDESDGNNIVNPIFEFRQLAVDIAAALRPQDSMFEQVLWRRNSNPTAAIHPNKTMFTGKGRAIYEALTGLGAFGQDSQ